MMTQAARASSVRIPTAPVDCENWIGGQWEEAHRPHQDVLSPYTGAVIGRVALSGPTEVDRAVARAREAAPGWAAMTMKDRAQVLFKLREILLKECSEIAHTVAAESGKLHSEAVAGLMKGVEVLEFALSLQNLEQGGRMEVSKGVWCEERRDPLGVVAGITPFNFPAMVPMWMMPIALGLGNAFVWKPSDKTPLTSRLLADAWSRAGLPKGVLTVVQGGVEAVHALCDHPHVRAIGFVGSTPVAQAVYNRATAKGKRALCLGGAKNPIILMPDADPEVVGQGITASYTGCAGQRCMAASLLLAVGDCDPLIQRVVEESSNLRAGEHYGAIITHASLDRITGAIGRAEKAGAKILLDGRGVKAPEGYGNKGNWLGPTILDRVQPGSEAAAEELFGPVLSIVRCKSLEEALQIQAKIPYGNAVSVFTQLGYVAEEVARRSHAGMVGVNIGVPVPREPFSFGGTYDSKFGHGDITGRSAVDFWTDRKKVTMKWSMQKNWNWMS
ncbi:MAG TPA: CoA-acylating methylmalonate-semialdehyde dehydrogenase [Bdellovibrionota bacterium]|jgi:malonate-semialdehyde dehydrogenase (acetylating)/methylmalonate-semialdehyde dehydrogenase|nr:CoA-acylating methylmalonate-semialdehyde dehydrogenase [Bdellovibrionota bacterium]